MEKDYGYGVVKKDNTPQIETLKGVDRVRKRHKLFFGSYDSAKNMVLDLLDIAIGEDIKKVTLGINEKDSITIKKEGVATFLSTEEIINNFTTFDFEKQKEYSCIATCEYMTICSLIISGNKFDMVVVSFKAGEVVTAFKESFPVGERDDISEYTVYTFKPDYDKVFTECSRIETNWIEEVILRRLTNA